MDTTYAPLVTRQKPIFVEGAPEESRGPLVQQATTGDPDAFARLFHAYAGRVYSYMYLHVADETAAEDLTARVFNKAWKNIRCYEFEPELPSASGFIRSPGTRCRTSLENTGREAR